MIMDFLPIFTKNFGLSDDNEGHIYDVAINKGTRAKRMLKKVLLYYVIRSKNIR